MAHKVIDLRERIPGDPAANQGAQPKSGGKVVVHYNGPPTGVPSGRTSVVEQISNDATFQMRPGHFGPGLKVNGIQYHAAVWEDTVYILRNPNARLWHCADGIAPDSFNYSGHAVHVPIGDGQRATGRTIRTLTEWVEKQLRDQGATSRNNVKGHQEISATLCPGTLMADFVFPFRAGKLKSGSFVDPVPFEAAHYNFMWVSEEWAKPRAEWISSHMNEAAEERLCVAQSGPGRVLWISQKAFESEPAGELVCVVVGEKTAAQLSFDAQSVLGKFDESVSDIWDGRDDDDLRDRLVTIVARHSKLQNKGLIKGFEEEFEVPPGKGVEPAEPDASDMEGARKIAGDALATKEQAQRFLRGNNAHERTFGWVELCWKWGEATGIRPDLLLAQECLETDFGRFTGKVPPSFHNVAGIKIKSPSLNDVREVHERFPSWLEGIRAHANHLCAYVGLEPVLGPEGQPVHDRYFVVASLPWAGTIKTTNGLSGRYAPRPDYASFLHERFLDPLRSA